MPDIPDSKAHAHPHKSAGKPRKRTEKKTTSPYAELAVTSNFTFLTGASHPDEFVYRAAELGYGAVAITDRNSLAGVVRAHVAAKDTGIPFVVGCRLELVDSCAAPEGPRLIAEGDQGGSPKSEAQRNPWKKNSSNSTPAGVEDIRARHDVATQSLTVLVYPTNRAAYGRLSRLLTLGKRRATKGNCLLMLDDLLEYQEGLLAIVLPQDQENIATLPNYQITKLRAAFDDDRLSLALSRLYGPNDQKHAQYIESLSAQFGIPLVAINDVYYHIPERRALQDVMVCVRNHCTLAEAGFRLFPNGERYLKDPHEMACLFADHPKAIARTMEIAARATEGNQATRQRGKKAITKCGFSLDQLRYEYPHETCPPGKTPMDHLIELTWQGADDRYPNGIPEKVRRQIEHEFELIEQLQYAPYFLTVHDLVKFARSRGILCQGRGAAANSAVCYSLDVTAVDPDRINLLFERFVSLERNEPPDIDIDFEHERREEVIQYIYEKYGRDRAGLTAEVITYRRRSAVRDVGKALGLSLDAVDRIAKRVDHWELNPFADSEAGDVKAQLAALGFDPADNTMRHLITLVDQIAGFPRHLSQHVGGFVMTEGLLCESVPIENAAMKDRTVIEWDKDDIEALGMLKVDVLGLGMLTCISKAINLLNRHEGTKARRHEGKDREPRTETDEEFGYEKKEEYDGDQDVSGSDCMAKGDGVGKNNLRSHASDARCRTLRLDDADETQRGVDTEQHRRGLCQTESNRLHSFLESSSRFTGGTGNSVDPLRTVGIPSISGKSQRSAPRNRSRTSRVDTKLGKINSRHEGTSCLIPHPSCLRAFVPPCLTLTSIPPEDPIVYDMMCKADTVGVFQIESRAQMTMLPRLKPRCFYDLVIEVAIVRPGPIIGDMVHPYLRRRNGEEKFTYPTPVIEEVLGKTLGVPLFQEQVMALAIKAAGFTAGEAEKLRRAITAWTSKDDIAKYPARFIEGMLRNGYDREFATWCFERMKGFSQYGFPESHAASFALLVYASAWIKCYHPAAFAAALLNSQPMGFYAPAQIIRDAQDHGVTVLPADVNHSDWDCTLENAQTLKSQNTEIPKRRKAIDLSGTTENSNLDPEGVKEIEGDQGGSPMRGLSEAIPPDIRQNIVSTLKGSQNDAARETISDFKSQIPNFKSQISNLKSEISNDEIQPALRLGMRVLRGLREADAKKIVETIRAHGPFTTPFALWQTSGVPASTLHCLAMGDAFQSMGLDRQHALWEVQQLHGKPLPLFDTRHEGQEITKSNARLPEIPSSSQVAADYRIIGFSLKDHPLSFLRELLRERGIITSAEAKDETQSLFGRRVAVAGLVLFRQRPGTARGVMFMTLEDETGRIDLIVRPTVYEKFRDAAVYSRLALALGRIERQNGVVHVLATAFESLDHLAAGLPAQSRDFR